MDKAIHGEAQARLTSLLRARREAAGLRQAEVASRLGMPQSFVSKYESGERRLDLVELQQVCHALRVDLVALVREFAGGAG